VALGAEATINWEYIKDPIKIISKLSIKGVQVVGIEQSEKSIDYKKVKVKLPTLFIVGNEVEGIEKKILEMCDIVAEIPMKGKKESLNVSVAFGVGLFRMLGV
jgi:tRNA G18 (ribose-2'-O)-methylase SpoU